MSILSDFEDRIGRALEHGFASVFRSPVQPAELARKLGREMDRGKKLGVGKVYAPTLYNILLSRQDDTALGGFAETLSGELETYLIGYAREHNYELATRPVVRFLVDKELKLGRFEIIGELLSPEELAEELGYMPEQEQFETPREPSYRSPEAPNVAAAGAVAAASAAAAAPVVIPEPEPVPVPIPEADIRRPISTVFDADGIEFDFTPSGPEPTILGEPDAPVAAAVVPPVVRSAGDVAGQRLATVTVKGVDHDVVLTGDRVVIGRLQACEICLADVNVSREHAEFEREGLGWAIRDLSSTNGTLVNGQAVKLQRLHDGDVIVVGITELIYHEPRG